MKRIPILAALMCLCAAASAQPIDTRNIAPRTELHPILSLTLSDEQFLKGDASGKPVTVSGQFRMALVAKEANLRGAMGVQGHFQKAGIPMWGSRAEQVWQTASKFSKEQLERGLKLIFEADRDLRSARPDDRTIVENFVVRLCA